MPFAKTWSEELIAEWLQMKGYLIEIGLPAGTPERGGRYEADVVGVKIFKDSMEILHIEVGVLARGKASVEILKKHGKWEDVDQLDTSALNKIMQDKEWDEEVLDSLSEYVDIEKSKRLYISKNDSK